MTPKFTEREQDVLKLVAKASQRKMIATELKISLKTVDAHLQNIRQKTNTHSIAELVLFLVLNGFL